METNIPAKSAYGDEGVVKCWIDEAEGEGKVKFAIKIEVGPFSVAYLNRDQLVKLINECNEAARVVD